MEPPFQASIKYKPSPPPPAKLGRTLISAITLAVLLIARSYRLKNSDKNKCIEHLLSALWDIGRILYEILVEKYFPLQINQF